MLIARNSERRYPTFAPVPVSIYVSGLVDPALRRKLRCRPLQRLCCRRPTRHWHRLASHRLITAPLPSRCRKRRLFLIAFVTCGVLVRLELALGWHMAPVASASLVPASDRRLLGHAQPLTTPAISHSERVSRCGLKQYSERYEPAVLLGLRRRAWVGRRAERVRNTHLRQIE